MGVISIGLIPSPSSSDTCVLLSGVGSSSELSDDSA